MASVYTNDLRLEEIGSGEQSGTWGDTTNTNLELIAEGLSYGTEGITTNANTHTSTVADGATDPARSMYIENTGTLDSACTITIAPNTLSRMHFIENGTSGSQNIIIKQGSGATITIPPGDTKAVYLDGAGSGAAVVDAFASLSVVDLKVQDDLTVTDDVSIGGLATIGETLAVTGVLTTTAATVFNGGFASNAASSIGGTTPTLTIGDAGAEDAKIVFDGNAADYHVGLDDSEDALQIGLGSALGTTPRITIRAAEVVANDLGIDIDFRVESDNLTHAFFVEGSTGQLRVNTASWPSNSFGDAAGRHIVGGPNEPLFVLWNEASAAANNLSTLAIGAKSATATTDFGGGWIRGGLENNSDSDGFLGFYTTKDAGANAEYLRITSAGNVGLGNASPGNTLVVRGLSSNGTGSTGNVAQFEGPSGTNGYQFFVNDTANVTGLQTKSADTFVINPAGGFVGIKTGTGQFDYPLAGLHVSDGTNVRAPQNSARAATIIIDAGATASADIQFLVRNGYNSHIFFGDAADANVGMLYYDHQQNDMIINTNAAECARFISEGGITFNGDTAAANALNDYEEGTWTPASPTVTFTGSPSGTYTKIGNVVTLHATLTVPSNTSSTQFLIDDLPFAQATNAAAAGFVLRFTTDGTYRMFYISGGSRIYVYSLNGAATPLATASTKRYDFSGSYQTA